MKPHTLVGIGEILWDVFPDGPRFGGAPSNFACSAGELARDTARACIVSAVGDDELGRRALEVLRERHVDTAGVQIQPRETGQVLVQLDAAGVARYRFAEDSAWDHLVWNDQLGRLAAGCDVVCFGTLGQRRPTSRAAIQRFVQSTPAEALRILDINLRAPFFDDHVILESLALANILKLNDEELPVLARLCGATGDEMAIIRQLADRFQLRYVALTRGADGAVIVSDNAVSDLPAVPVPVADTVGAGDAYTAAMTLGLLAGDSIDDVNRRAIATASYVCSRPGATMSFPDHLAFGKSAAPNGNTDT